MITSANSLHFSAFIQDKILPFFDQSKKIILIAIAALAALILLRIVVRSLRNRNVMPIGERLDRTNLETTNNRFRNTFGGDDPHRFGNRQDERQEVRDRQQDRIEVLEESEEKPIEEHKREPNPDEVFNQRFKKAEVSEVKPIVDHNREPNPDEVFNQRFKKAQECSPVVKAEVEFKQLRESYPNNEKVLNRYVEILSLLNKEAEVLEEYRKFLALEPKNFSVLFNYARELSRQEKFDEAIAQAKKGLENKPEDDSAKSSYSDILSAYARFLLRQKKVDEAAVQYKNAVEYDPNNVFLFRNYVDVLFNLNKIDEAFREYERVIKENPTKNVELIKFYAFDLANLGRFADADVQFKKALESPPEDAFLFRHYIRNLKKLKKDGDTIGEEVIGEHKRVLAIYPKNVDYLRTYGQELSEQKKFQEAADQYKKILEIDPTDRWTKDLHQRALQDHAKGLLDLKKGDEAIAQYQKALAIYPDNQELLLNYIEALETLEKFDEAKEEYKKLPDNAEVLFAYGNFLFNRGENKEAAAQFEKIFANTTNNIFLCENYPKVLRNLGRNDDAVRIEAQMLEASNNFYK